MYVVVDNNIGMVEWQDLFDYMAWIYSLAWSLSFYGQICENYHLKNVYGMSINFAIINVHGFILYAIYNIYGFAIQQSQTGKIEVADLVFALHALTATIFTGLQAMVYPRGQNKVSPTTYMIVGGQWLFIAVYYTAVRLALVQPSPSLGVVSIIGYFKLAATCLKYTPQLYWNYSRKSTKGWSIFNVAMDLTGGVFSFTEIILRGVYQRGVYVNTSKLLLGLFTILYDVLFIVQHYYLYPQIELQENSKVEIGSTSPVNIESNNQTSTEMMTLQMHNQQNQ